MKNQIINPVYCRGVTLIELMVALIVAAILLGVGMPSFVDFIRDNQTVSETNKLIRDLNYARSEAVQRGITVSLCRSNTGTGCTATNWQDGWIVFTDENDNRAVDGADEVLQVSDGLDANFTLPVANVNNGLTFNPDGTASAAGSFEVLPPASSHRPSRQVDVSAIGRVTVQINAVP